MSASDHGVQHSALLIAETLRALASTLPNGPARQRAWAELTDAILDEEPELFGQWFIRALSHFAVEDDHEDGAPLA